MEIVAEGHDWLNFRPCQAFLDFLTENGIRSSENGPHSWTTEQVLTVHKDTPIDPWMAAFGLGHYPRYGSFTYSFSGFPIGVAIGRYCSVSWNVRILGPGHAHWLVSSAEMMYRPDTPFAAAFAHYGVDWSYYPNPQKPEPVIGNDVWIGQDVLLARGIRLGDGCVIGAGTVVTKDVPPYAIMGGAPARLLRWRFPAEVIEGLQEVRWWNYALPQLGHLSLDDPARFIGEMTDAIARGELQELRCLGLADAVIKSFV